MLTFLRHNRGRIGLLASLVVAAGAIGTGECALAEALTGQPASDRPVAVAGFQSGLPVEGRLPSLEGATNWLNSPPLTEAQLRGKIILVDFWAYSCINCLRTAPYLKAWAEKYRDRGLVVIGVHTPEFRFETKLENIQRAINRSGLTYPIAVDSDRHIWDAFGNQYWPAVYFIDDHGRIRHHQFGEGNYEQSEHVIQELLAEHEGHGTPVMTMVTPNARGAEAAPDLADVGSGETYLGYAEQTGFNANQRLDQDNARTYSFGALDLNQWALSGRWTIGAEHAVLNDANGTVAYRFHARDLHLVLGREKNAQPVHFQVLIDGKPPGADHGADTDAEGRGVITETRLYQLVRQTGAVMDRTFEIRLLDPGADAYSFTFG